MTCKLLTKLLCACSLIGGLGCNKPQQPDGPLPPPEDSLTSPIPVAGELVSGELSGILMLHNGNPWRRPPRINGVNIPPENVNESGFFQFSHPGMNADATLFEIDAGFNMPISVPVLIRAGRKHFIKKRAMPWSNFYYQGMIVGGMEYPPTLRAFEMSFPDGCWQNGGQILTTGVLSYHPVVLNNATLNLAEMQPGDMRGINLQNKRVVLQPYLMAGFVFVPNGNLGSTDVVPGKKIEVSLAVPSKLKGIAPAEAPLWEYDPVQGLWIESGVAILEQNRYKCPLTQKGFFCIAQAAPPVFINLKFADVKNNALVRQSVIIRTQIPGTPFYWPYNVYTDDQGEISAYVPYNAKWLIELTDDCGDRFFYRPMNPVTDNFWETLTIPTVSSNNVHVSGKAFSCDLIPMKKGTVTVKAGPFEYMFPVEDGTYAFDIPYCTNISEGNYQYKIYDSLTGQSTDFAPVTLKKGENTIIEDLEVCTDQIKYLNGDIVFNVEGGSHTLTGLRDSVHVRSMIDPYSKRRIILITGFNNNTRYKFGLTFAGNSPGTYSLYTCVAATPAHWEYLMTWGIYFPGIIQVEELDIRRGVVKASFSSTVNRTLTSDFTDTTTITGTIQLRGN